MKALPISYETARLWARRINLASAVVCAAFLLWWVFLAVTRAKLGPWSETALALAWVPVVMANQVLQMVVDSWFWRRQDAQYRRIMAELDEQLEEGRKRFMTAIAVAEADQFQPPIH